MVALRVGLICLLLGAPADGPGARLAALTERDRLAAEAVWRRAAGDLPGAVELQEKALAAGRPAGSSGP